MAKPVVTRFAPSPTGYLHIGGARTALFNWLYARHTGGKMLLRIEDTDRERSTEPAIAAILDGLKWLELDWDGEPLYQFARVERHREVALELLAAGKAYHCYLSQAETETKREAISAEREQAKKEKRPPKGPQKIESPWRDRDPKDAPPGVKPVIRLKAPLDGETVIEDRVQGRVVWQNADLDDMIILRSDGTPVYNHAVVVDDHDMGITQVIRGVDHLTNAARQVQIYKAMNWEIPVFAHVPLIHGPDGAKLSKRHGSPAIETYRAMGYLPAGLRNYLARLGWSHGDDEIFSTAQMIEWFDIDDINKAPGRLDFAKLADVNAHYIRQAITDELLARIKDFLPGAEGGPALASRIQAVGWDKLAAALPSLKERAKTLKELVDGAGYLLASRPLALDDKAAKLLDAEARANLAKLLALFEGVTNWTAPAIETRGSRFRRCERPETGQNRPAAPGGAYRLGRVAPRIRRHGGAGSGRGPARIRDQAQ